MMSTVSEQEKERANNYLFPPLLRHSCKLPINKHVFSALSVITELSINNTTRNSKKLMMNSKKKWRIKFVKIKNKSPRNK
jgi:hypothetical protein